MPGTAFRPANQHDADALEKIKNGSVINAKFTQPRNPLFHRKFFALLGFAYEYWNPDPDEIMSSKFAELLPENWVPEKNFERFRKDILILAGYRTIVVNVKNEIRYEAESISFASMDDVEFQQLYSTVFNVVWEMVVKKITGMTPEIAENTINQMLSFD